MPPQKQVAVSFAVTGSSFSIMAVPPHSRGMVKQKPNGTAVARSTSAAITKVSKLSSPTTVVTAVSQTNKNSRKRVQLGRDRVSLTGVKKCGVVDDIETDKHAIVEEKIEVTRQRNVDVQGQVIVRYNHYREFFPTLNGVLQAADIAEKYSFDFAFKGNYKLHLFEFPGDGIIYNSDYPVAEDQAQKIFLNCTEGVVYRVTVEPDPAQEMSRIKPCDFITKEDAEALSYGRQPRTKSQSSGVNLITDELKKLSTTELSEQGSRYKSLIEARDLEECIFSS